MTKDSALLTGSLRTGALFGGGFSLAGKDLQDCYEGQVSVETGKRQGKGKYVYPNRSFSYDGEYVDGKKSGHGRFFIEGHSLYEGNFENDEIQGQGRQVYADGSTYEGEFHLGEKHGKGTFVNKKKKERYTGEFLGNSRHGQGSLVLEDARGSLVSYEGQFVENKILGEGRLLPASGVAYEGNFAQDLDSGIPPLQVSLTGYGKIKFPDGSYQEGQFERNKLNGTGLNYDVATGITFKGQFEHNVPTTVAKSMTCKFYEEKRAASPSTAQDAEDGAPQEAESGGEQTEAANAEVQGGEPEEKEKEANDGEAVEAEAEGMDADGDVETTAEGPNLIDNEVLELPVAREQWGRYFIRICVETEVEIENETVAEGENDAPSGDEVESNAEAAVESEESTPIKDVDGTKNEEEEGSKRTELCVFAGESGRTVRLRVTKAASEEEAPVEAAEGGGEDAQESEEIEAEVETLEGIAKFTDLGDLLATAGPGRYSLEFSSTGLEPRKLTIALA
ncbi:MORN repeat domain-containing protein [Chloropicon primus]|nr:MORN repeat domain-containing protein [Chloropicon primus]